MRFFGLCEQRQGLAIAAFSLGVEAGATTFQFCLRIGESLTMPMLGNVVGDGGNVGD